MPINQKYPLEELLDACEYFRSKKKQKITFEYILIQGVNDSPDDARELAKITRRLEAKVNVIPYNSVDGLDWQRPSETEQDEFLAVLHRGAASATIRREKGHDIAAACGQLRLQTERKIPVAADGGVN
jgi:23S rRNA (adenine2503-C2)-methyltransferase